MGISLSEFVFSRHVLFETTFHVDQAALKLLILLFLPPNFWDAGICQHTQCHLLELTWENPLEQFLGPDSSSTFELFNLD